MRSRSGSRTPSRTPSPRCDRRGTRGRAGGLSRLSMSVSRQIGRRRATRRPNRNRNRNRNRIASRHTPPRRHRRRQRRCVRLPSSFPPLLLLVARPCHGCDASGGAAAPPHLMSRFHPSLLISCPRLIPLATPSPHPLLTLSRPTLASPSRRLGSSRLVSSPPSRPLPRPTTDATLDDVHTRPHNRHNPTQVELNGDASARYPGCLNYSFAYVEGESLLMALKNIAVSSGSACTSASLEACAGSVPHADWLPFAASVTAPCLARAELRAARDRRRRGARAHLDPLRHR